MVVWAENLEEARELLRAEYGQDTLRSLWNEGDAQDQLDEIMPRFKADQGDRARRLVGQEDVVRDIQRVLFRFDPIGINFGPADEYQPVAETITLRLSEASSEGALLRIIHEELVMWFSASIVGPMTKYQQIASAMWVLLASDGQDSH